MTGLRRLWRGELPLKEAFWTWAVGIGLTINLAALLISLILVTEDRAVAALVVGHGISVPYNIVATVGVWRSAAHHPNHSDAVTARIVTVVMMVVLTII
jgi:hypothetical protein